MRRTALHFSCCLIWLVGPGMVAAQSELLDLVPQDALGVVVVNRLGASSAKVEKLAQQLHLPIPSPLMAVKATTGVTQGIDESKPAGLFLMKAADGGDKPAGILLVPVTDYKQFLAQFHPEDASGTIVEVKVADAQALVAEKGGYAAFTLPTDKAVLESALGSTTNISSSLRPLSTWLKSQEIAALITRNGVRMLAERLGTQLVATAGQLEKLGPQQRSAAKMLEQYRTVLELAQREVTHLGIGLKVDQSLAIHLTTRTIVTKGSTLSKLLADIKGKEALLSRLPNDPFVVASSMIFAPSWVDQFSGLVGRFAEFNPAVAQGGSEQTTEVAQAMSEVTKETMQGVKGFSVVLGATKPDEPMYARTVGVMAVDDSEAFLKRYQAALQKMNAVAKKAPGQIPQYDPKPMKFEGHDGLQLTMEMQVPPGPGADAMKKIMEKMFGPGGKTNIYITAADKTAVIMAYVTQDNLKRALDAYQAQSGGLTMNSQVQATAKLLPKNSHWIFYVSPRHGIAWIKSLMQGTLGAALTGKIPDFPDTPPIGAAATFFPIGVATDLVVPIDVTKAIGQYVNEVQKMRQPPPAEQPEEAQ